MNNTEFKMINKTIISPKERQDLNNLVFKTKFIPLILTYEIAILCFVVYAFVINNLTVIIISLAVLVLLPIMVLIANKINDKKSAARFSGQPQMEFEFVFKETKVGISAVQGLSRQSVDLEYDKIYQVIVTKENIFIFITSSSAYVVAKRGFENFDYLAFESVVKPNVKRYKVVNK